MPKIAETAILKQSPGREKPKVRKQNFRNLERDEVENELIEGCLRGESRMQERFYRHFYGYGMSISLRYAANKEEAAEVLNDSFLKIFDKLHKHDRKKSFKAWIRRLIINTALDRFRKEKKRRFDTDIEEARYETSDENALDRLSAEEILNLLHELPPTYRAVFNLYEIEGFSHEEIGKMLNMPVGTSKSNLSRAKAKLRTMIRLQESPVI